MAWNNVHEAIGFADAAQGGLGVTRSSALRCTILDERGALETMEIIIIIIIILGSNRGNGAG